MTSIFSTVTQGSGALLLIGLSVCLNFIIQNPIVVDLDVSTTCLM